MLYIDPHFIDNNPHRRALSVPVRTGHCAVLRQEASVPRTATKRRPFPMGPRQLQRHTCDCIQPGTTDLFAAPDVKACTDIAEGHIRLGSLKFRSFLQTVERAKQAHLDLHLVLDNARFRLGPSL